MKKEHLCLCTHTAHKCPFHSDFSLLTFFPPPFVRDSRCLWEWETQFLLPQGARNLGSSHSAHFWPSKLIFFTKTSPQKKLPKASESRAFITTYGWLQKRPCLKLDCTTGVFFSFLPPPRCKPDLRNYSERLTLKSG